MPDFALWPSPENYDRFREIMDDGNKFPHSFNEWQIMAQRQTEFAKSHGITIKPVPFDEEKFIVFCREHKLPRSSKGRAAYAVAVGTAGISYPADRAPQNDRPRR
jgi:hypothetical protein